MNKLYRQTNFISVLITFSGNRILRAKLLNKLLDTAGQVNIQVSVLFGQTTIDEVVYTR